MSRSAWLCTLIIPFPLHCLTGFLSRSVAMLPPVLLAQSQLLFLFHCNDGDTTLERFKYAFFSSFQVHDIYSKDWPKNSSHLEKIKTYCKWDDVFSLTLWKAEFSNSLSFLSVYQEHLQLDKEKEDVNSSSRNVCL